MSYSCSTDVDTGAVGTFAVRAYLGLGAAAIAVYLAVGGSVGIYDGLGLTSVGVIALGVTRYRPANWRGWVAIAISQALFAAGDIDYHHFPPASFPALPDAFYLTGYVALFAGFVLFVGRSFAWRDVASHVDALLITVAVGLSGWILFLGGTFAPGFDRTSLVAIAYPLVDLLALGLLVRIALAPGRRNPAYRLVLAAVILLFVGNGTYVVPAVGDAYRFGGWFDACWLATYVLLSAAALHPSMGAIADTGREAGRHPLRRVVAGGIALVLIPVVAVAEQIIHGSVDVTVVALGGSVLIAGMAVRAALLVGDLDRLRARTEESERRFRMIFERAPIGISVGRNGIMSETNPALQRMLGYTGDELARMHYTDVTHADDRALAVQAELDAGTRDSFIAEKQYVRKDGVVADSRVHVTLDLEDGLGMSLIEDITEHRALERQLVQAQKMDAVGKLAGGVAHDFNNLMTAVIGYSDLLLRRPEIEGSSREKVEAIRDSANRASDLTRQLLAFSRRQVLQTTDLDLRQIVERMDTLLRRLIGEDLRLEKLFGAEPVVVRADRTQLEQVVMNLAVNARDAMPQGGTLTIGVVSDGGSAVLSVSDSGTGMDERTLGSIFEPFFTTKPLSESAGLGLSTVYGIVAQSGGTIAVESEVGRGTVFTIRLPLAPTTPKAVLPPAPRAATLVD